MKAPALDVRLRGARSDYDAEADRAVIVLDLDDGLEGMRLALPWPDALELAGQICRDVARVGREADASETLDPTTEDES